MLKVLNKTQIHTEKLIVALLAAIQFSHILDFVVIMPLGPVLMRHFQINPTQFALLVSSYNISAAIMGLLLGLIADKFDRKLLLQISFFCFALATLFCAFSFSYNSFLVTRIIAGAFGGALNTLVFSIITDLIPFERRGKAMGTIMASFSITSILGIPLGLLIADTFGWRYCFVFITLFSFLVIIGGHFILPKIPITQRDLKISQSVKRLFKIAINRNYLQAYALLMSLAFSGFLIFPFLSPYAVKNIGISESEIKYIYLFGGLLTIVMSRVSGRLTDKYGTLRVFIPSILFSIPLITLYTQVENLSLSILLVISSLFMAVMTFRAIPAMTLITSIPTNEERGGFMSVLNSFRSLASALATLIAGFMITESADKLVNFDNVGYLSVFISVIAISLAIILQNLKKGINERAC
jgi:predicted MFS family arabinose efflux permease